MPIDNIMLLALIIGLVSAVSLPLGTLTTLIWTPQDKAIAWLMAFGAGALLSAVTIDLFAPSLSNNLFLETALGALAGSAFYLSLNALLNQQGGFLRKTATTIQYFRGKQTEQRLQFQASLNRLPFFNRLPDADKHVFLQQATQRRFKQGQMVFHHGDSQNRFFIIQQGTIKLRDPTLELKTFMELGPGDTFGRMAFFTNRNNATLAQAATDTVLWEISKDNLNQLLKTRSPLSESLCRYYDEDSELRHYLRTRHAMTEAETQQHLAQIRDELQTHHALPIHPPTPRDLSLAQKRLQRARRFSVLTGLTEDLQSLVASKMALHTLPAGQAIFKNKSPADRLYLLESGTVKLVDPKKKQQDFERLQPGDFFGVMGFVVGGDHATTAITQSDCQYWVIEKPAFIQLLHQIDQLNARVRDFLRTDDISHYLTQEQRLKQLQAQKWLNRSIKHLLPGQLPTLADAFPPARHNMPKAAYMAIWLGILLDGIPESLMIGAHLSQGEMISMSLVAGLFLSNYPEALSSSASMREQGIPFYRVLGAWTLLMLLTGLGAALGQWLLADASAETAALISGIAAGAMLTVIAETMLPEAYSKGGSIIGMVTLIGFITAMSFKLFD
ncbi:cyclic nucleotide-binding domain-containing protein [Hydrogenovibrio halophilus]|uniref:cyclic nucleotide-binding domain-containing protein n=1 Tax=Hydrogenovibrio halophilus TaxID=373391 RepID=UPI000363841F|nr:cyclic nucleotide-binding domain-containing protein [Hydrogenovibrio halophilus]